MPINAAHWTINGSKVIDYIGDDHLGASPSYASGIELHRWFGDLSDDPTFSGDDIIDRTLPVPTKRSTDYIFRLLNGYTITATAIEHLYDCSITQGVAGVDQKIWDAITVFGNSPNIQLLQNGAHLTDDWWNSNGGINPDTFKGITHRFLILVHDFAGNGGDIDGRKIIGTTRNWGKTHKEFVIAETERGKNSLPLDEADDINNVTLRGDVSALIGITNQTEGYIGIDADGDTTDEFYWSSWTKGANGQNDLYEFTKEVVSVGSAATLYGLPAALFRGVTHAVTYGTLAGGTFLEATAVTFGNGATGQVMADNNTNKMWVQILTGAVPVDTDTITQGGVTAAVSGAPVEFKPATPFLGVSTGSAIIGAFGQGISDVLTTSDKLTDLTGTPISPPDVVNFGVSNLEIADGSVTVYPWDGVTLDAEGNPAVQVDQMQIAGVNLTGAAVVSIQVNAIPANTPDTGNIRVVTNSGKKLLVTYTAHNGTDTFTVTSTDFSGDNATIGNNSFIAYLDLAPTGASEGFTYTYGSDKKVVVEVRDPVNLIIPFITGATLSNASQTINTIRNSDA